MKVWAKPLFLYTFIGLVMKDNSVNQTTELTSQHMFQTPSEDGHLVIGTYVEVFVSALVMGINLNAFVTSQIQLVQDIICKTFIWYQNQLP